MQEQVGNSHSSYYFIAVGVVLDNSNSYSNYNLHSGRDDQDC